MARGPVTGAITELGLLLEGRGGARFAKPGLGSNTEFACAANPYVVSRHVEQTPTW